MGLFVAMPAMQSTTAGEDCRLRQSKNIFTNTEQYLTFVQLKFFLNHLQSVRNAGLRGPLDARVVNLVLLLPRSSYDAWMSEVEADHAAIKEALDKLQPFHEGQVSSTAWAQFLHSN